MPDDTPDDAATPQPDAGSDNRGWDPRMIMRERAAATRTDRDQAIADLRAAISDDDEEILDEFGINLDQIES